MRADYATSDLISKVNSDWINEVLANRECGRPNAGGDVPRDDITDDMADDVADDVRADEVHGHGVGGNNVHASDLRLRREFARKRTILLQRGSSGIDPRESRIAANPMDRLSRHRSVARRVKERLALAVAVLMLVGVAVWMAPEPQDATNAVSTPAASAAPEQAAPVDTAELQPGWLLPEILYGPAMARTPVSRADVLRPAPRPGH
jgi:hypothetical protein